MLFFNRKILSKMKFIIIFFNNSNDFDFNSYNKQKIIISLDANKIYNFYYNFSN